MKRYYYKKDETELARLKSDLSYYAKVMDLILSVTKTVMAGLVRSVRIRKHIRRSLLSSVIPLQDP